MKIRIPDVNSDLNFINTNYDFSKLNNIERFDEDGILLKNGKKFRCDCGYFFPINQASLEGMDELFK